jgi:hypothetical protein
MTAVLKLRGALLAALATLAFALVTPAIDHASAAPKNGGAGKVTCPGGGEPGDIQTTHTHIYVNGNPVGTTTVRQICGEDGKWHEIAELVAASGTRFPATTAVGLRPTG